MKYLEVKNWSEFQHYKDRTPPWIKLSTSVFQDYEFACLQDASKLLAFCIWTLASRYKDPKLGYVPADFEWIKKQGNLSDFVQIEHLEELVKSGFLIDASNALADCKQNACPEERQRRGRDRGKEKENTAFGSTKETEKPSTGLPSPSVAADAADASTDFQKVFRVIVGEVPGLETKNPNAIHSWLKAGCSVELDIVPTIPRVKAHADGPINSFNYFTKGISEAKAAREAGMPIPTTSAEGNPKAVYAAIMHRRRSGEYVTDKEKEFCHKFEEKQIENQLSCENGL